MNYTTFDTGGHSVNIFWIWILSTIFHLK